MNRPKEPTLHTDGTVDFDTRITMRIGDRVLSRSCGFQGVLLGGDSRHAVVREDDGAVTAWEWEDLQPASAARMTNAAELRTYESLEGLPGALAEIGRSSSTAKIKEAQVAVRQATLEALAKIWPDHAELISRD